MVCKALSPAVNDSYTAVQAVGWPGHGGTQEPTTSALTENHERQRRDQERRRAAVVAASSDLVAILARSRTACPSRHAVRSARYRVRTVPENLAIHRSGRRRPFHCGSGSQSRQAADVPVSTAQPRRTGSRPAVNCRAIPKPVGARAEMRRAANSTVVSLCCGVSPECTRSAEHAAVLSPPTEPRRFFLLFDEMVQVWVADPREPVLVEAARHHTSVSAFGRFVEDRS
jgi:hypothetical protein